jgi:TolB-like protein/DNA-binding winged helix-turn-helix (wHTH) protein/Tfp pilus assembly protein PilF
MDPSLTPTRLQFGPFVADFGACELLKDGKRIRLQDKPMRLLAALTVNPGEVVSREHLQKQLWPDDTFVDFETGLNTAVRKLREALADNPENPQYVETIPKHGYRFLAEVHKNGAHGGSADAEKSSPVAPTSTSLGERTIASLVETVAEYRRSKRLWVVVAAALALGGLAVLLEQLNVLKVPGLHEWVSGTSGASTIHSLAVLPLQNLSSDPSQEYFSDGMTDALITDLAQISSLRVISRTSSMQYKQTKKSLPEIARELNVDGIIEGTVQRSGDRVRITAQLIYGPSDKHLWANSYERDLSDAFALERDVAQEIVDRVQARIGTRNQGQLRRSGPANYKALDAYLRGNYYLSRSDRENSDDEKRTAAQYFQQAVDADPDFVRAYIGLASAHAELLRGSSDDTAIRKRAAEKALALDPNSSDAWEILGHIKWYEFDWAGAEQDYRKAVSLDANRASYLCGLGALLAATGRLDEALKEGEISQGLDPHEDRLSPILEMRGEHKRAIQLLQRMVEQHPDDVGYHVGLFRNYAESGMYREATQELEKVFTLMELPEVAAEIHRAFAASGYSGAMREAAKALENLYASNQAFLPESLAYAHVASGDKDGAFYWLEQAYEHRENVSADWGLTIIKEDRLLDPLRSDPRFKDLLRRVGLPP